MAKCPSCGIEVAKPVKNWSMIGKPSKSGEIIQLTIGLYECTICKKRFRDVISKEKINIKETVQKIKMLEDMVMEAAKKKAELEEKIKALEEEKAGLLAEIEALKAISELEAKSSALEAEVAKLKEEKKALEEKIQPAEAPAPAEEKPPEEAPIEEQPCVPTEEKPREEAAPSEETL